MYFSYCQSRSNFLYIIPLSLGIAYLEHSIGWFEIDQRIKGITLVGYRIRKGIENRAKSPGACW